MAGLSDYLAEAVLNFVTGSSPIPALGSRYVALFTAAPTTDAGTVAPRCRPPGHRPVSEMAQERRRDRTPKIRLYDKLAAMGHLAKLLNLLVDRQEISGPNGGPVEVTDHRVRIMDRLNATTGITKTWLVDKLEAIIDADLADVSEWDGDGKLVFKTSSELTAEQKVAVSQIAQERGRDGARTLRSGFTTSSQPWATSPSYSICLLVARKSAGRTVRRLK
jgi:hypothetical protein